MKMGRIIKLALMTLIAIFLASNAAIAQSTGNCPRPNPGSEVTPPPDLFSSNGVLNVSLNYYGELDEKGLALFCFATADGVESPTLHVNPGDTINITLTNTLPNAPGAPSEIVSNDKNTCGSKTMTYTSTNMHFHGINTSPKCHSDEVIHTLVNSGQTFNYKIKIPANEPPGMYWYHPHVHGISSPTVQGGATGAIIVEGIENIQPAVAGLPQRILLLRDQTLPSHPTQSSDPPFWDLSVNYVPVTYPKYIPTIIKMRTAQAEFWRVANASANSILDLQVKYDGRAQPLQIVALDGVPAGSQDGKRQGTIITRKDIFLSPAGRVEFIVQPPNSSVKKAEVITNYIDSGPQGDFLPARRLAVIQASAHSPKLPKTPVTSAAPHSQRFEELASLKPTAKRKLFFSEAFGEPRQARRLPPESKHMHFFITVDGQSPHLFDPNNPPDIITTRGAIEDWTIENRSDEMHMFHMHQIHFLLLEVNGVPVPKKQQQFYDTYPVDYWDDINPTYPSIKVRMDFRGAVVGDFVYHCHILDHEDLGMMAIIRVLPKGAKSKPPQHSSLQQASRAIPGVKRPG
jgi:FtsP/CotA-like multicopper oxidase with cupredoxin domain